MVNIDGIIAVILFITFVSWSFVYFINVFNVEESSPLMEAMTDISKDITDYLSVDYYEVPVKFNAPVTGPDALYIDYIWPSTGSKNSTMLYQGGNPIGCNITGNRLYWDANTVPGNNFYTITYSEKNTTMNCTGGFSTSPVNMTIPLSSVKSKRLSQTLLSNMLASDYGTIKNQIGIPNEFRIEFNISGSLSTFGIPAPNSSSVFAKTTRLATETGNQVTVTVMVWE